MEIFREIRPAAHLAPFVKQYWILETDAAEGLTQRVIPTGSVSLMFYPGSKVISKGSRVPHTCLSGQFIGYDDLICSGRVRVIAAVFRPAGAKAFFPLPMGELFGASVSADEMNDRELSDLGKRIMDTADYDRAVALIEDFLTRRLRSVHDYNTARIHAAVGTVDADIFPSLSAMSAAACLSERQLNRLFTDYTGATPKQFMRIVRFQRALRTLQTNKDMDFTVLAADCGFFDQSHLIREFKTFSGYTPREYLLSCEPYSDYFG